jgi:hypothetical protein
MAQPSEQFVDRTFDNQRGKRVSPMSTIGHGGIAIYGGFLQNNDKNPELIGLRKYKTFSEILANVAIVAAGVRYRLGQVGKANWTFQPASETNDEVASDEAIRIAELVEDILYDMATPFPKVVRRASLHQFYGFSVQEWTAKKRDDGVIGFKDIEPRAQHTIERWDIDVSGTVHGVEQTSPQTLVPIYIPRAKILYVVDDTLNESPEGMGILRHLAPVTSRLQRFEQLEGFGLESDLRGIPVGRAPYRMLMDAQNKGLLTEAQRLDLVREIEEFVGNHIKNPALGLVLDSQVYQSQDEGSTPSSVRQFDIELLKSESSSQGECAAAINRLCWEAAILLGIEGMLLGAKAEGSYALSKDKSSSFALRVDSALSDVAEAIRRDILGPLFALNGWDRALMPEPIPEKMQRASVQEITAALRDIATAGAPLDVEDQAIDVVRTLLGLPEHETINLELDAQLRRDETQAGIAATAAGGAGEPGGGKPNPNGSPPNQSTRGARGAKKPGGRESGDDDGMPTNQDNESKNPKRNPKGKKPKA